MYFNGKLLQVVEEVEEGSEVVFHKDFSVELDVYNHQRQLDQLVIRIYLILMS